MEGHLRGGQAASFIVAVRLLCLPWIGHLPVVFRLETPA